MSTFGKGSTVICTACGAANQVKSDYSAMIVCHRCRKVHFKNGSTEDVAVGISEDMSLIQIGTKGKINNGEFEVIGRCKIDAEGAYYNLWAIHFRQGDKLDWLLDSFGEYLHLVNKKISWEDVPQGVWGSNCGLKYDLPQLGEYRLVSRPALLAIYIEGELPELPTGIKRSVFLELAREVGVKALLIRDEEQKVYCLAGSEMQWNEFRFLNVRKSELLGS